MKIEETAPVAASERPTTVEPVQPAGSVQPVPNRLREWPVSKQGLVLWLLAFVVMTGGAILIGFLIVDDLAWVRHLDTDVSRWLGDHRTATWNSVTWWGSGLAEAVVKITATVVLSLFFIWRYRRWSEPALLAGALVLEVMVFITSSFVVGRARPPISQLDTAPPTSSYPSGHTAAAVAFYGALAIIVVWHTRNRWARALVIIAAVVIPPIVAASRLYRGMHHLSDVVVGAVIGALSLWITWLVVRARGGEYTRR
jgi:undecaprenyl-diphosphatase